MKGIFYIYAIVILDIAITIGPVTANVLNFGFTYFSRYWG